MGEGTKTSRWTARVAVAATVLTLAAALAVAGALPGPAGASLAQNAVVSVNPADNTPSLTNNSPTDATHVFAQVGDVMYVGGTFPQIGGVARSNIAAFRVSTGEMLPFSPSINGPVWAIVPTADGHLIVGGAFGVVNGVSRRGLVRLTTAGAVVPGFNARLNGAVHDAQLVNGRIIASGAFTQRLAAFDPVTGANTGYINFSITGTVDPNLGGLVFRFAVSPANDRLVAIGSFTSVGGQSRTRAFMLDLGAASATLSQWYYPPLARACQASTLPDYLRDVDFSPDGSYFVIVSTGFVPLAGDIGTTLCDATARFETTNLSPNRPTWINYTGGDTLHSVAVTGAAVYVGGHQRWLDNPEGRDTCGPGCVSREGIGAISPTTGKALTWNPVRARGVGAKVLYATPTGLWVGSDTRFGGRLGCARPGGPNLDDCTGKGAEQHPGIGFLPLPPGPPPPNQAPVAVIDVNCSGLSCAVSASRSSDTDGSITGYSWAFGDGATATGVTASHTYAAAGAPTITLTVTDDDLATGQATASVSVAPQESAISFVGQTMSNLNATTHTVSVPAAVSQGDGLLLVISSNTTASIAEPSGVTGWQVLDTVTTASSVTRVWRKVAGPADAGGAVRVVTGAMSKANVVLAAYRGTSIIDPVATYARAGETVARSTHTTPEAPVASGNSWAVSYWSHKDATTNALLPPPGVVVRASGTQASAGRVTGLLADSGASVAPGTYGGRVATAAATSANASMWTIVLAPA